MVEERKPSPGAKMNKADLIDRIADGCGISKTQAANAIDTTVESITGALKKGDRVALIGFGTFSTSSRKARNGRNPQSRKIHSGRRAEKSRQSRQVVGRQQNSNGRGSALPFCFLAYEF